MLLRHSAYYLLARGVPGIVNFAALAVYTRLLAPEDFGRYALVLAGVGLVNVIFFQWLRLVLARFLSAHQTDPQRFLAGILALFLILAVAVTGLGALLALGWPDPVWRRLLALAVPLLLVQAWFEINLELARARLLPAKYGKLLGSKAVFSLFIGGGLAWAGLGAVAPLTGLLIAHVVSFLFFAMGSWRGVSPRWPDTAALRAQLNYGLPLTVTLALAWVISSSDRLLLLWLVDEFTVGVYAAGYDFSFQGLVLLLAIINTAAYPLAVNEFEKNGPVEAKMQLAQNGELIIAAAMAGAVGLIVLGPQFVALLIGEDFRVGALQILPWLAVASAFACIKAYHFDIAFHLGRNSRWLLITGGVAAIINLALNLLLIPNYGILGAAWATLGAFAVAAATSAGLGRFAFAMPAVLPLVLKGVITAFLVGLSAWLGAGLSEIGWVGLGLGLFSGMLMVLVAGLAVNLCGLRTAVWKRCRNWRRLPCCR